MLIRASLALCVILLGACAKPTPTAVQIDPALSTLIPPDTNLIVAARLEALKKTPLYQKHIAKADFPQLEELGKYTGIDARKDLWELLFVSDGKNNVLLGRGNFAADMESKLEREGAKVVPHKMYHIVGSPEGSVVFINSTTAAVGSMDSLRAFLDARGKTNGPPPAIAEQMKEIPAGIHLWAISLGGGRNVTLPLPGTKGGLGVPMDNGTVYLDFADGIKGQARATSATPEGAKQLHDAMKGIIGFGRLGVPADQPALLRAFDGLQVSQENNVVRVKIEEPADVVDRLIEFAASQRPRGR